MIYIYVYIWIETYRERERESEREHRLAIAIGSAEMQSTKSPAWGGTHPRNYTVVNPSQPTYLTFPSAQVTHVVLLFDHALLEVVMLIDREDLCLCKTIWLDQNYYRTIWSRSVSAIETN